MSRPHSPMRFAAVAVTLAVVLGLPGCGGSENARTSEAADSELAQKIKDSAAYRRGQSTATTIDPLAPELPAEPRLPSTVELPAGSDEIDGPTTVEPEAPVDAQKSRGIFSSADRASFRELAAELPGSEGVAVTGLGRRGEVESLGALRSGVAWSTAKLPVAMAAIRAGTAATADLRAAITASDNAAAERLWSSLGVPGDAAALATKAVRDSGDSRTAIQSRRLRPGFTAFGQTAWSLGAQARFVAGMACAQAGPEVLGLMDDVVASQRWGIAAAASDAQFKGGWGPGVNPGVADGWLERQVGIAKVGRGRIAIAIATTAPGHQRGTTTLTQLAKWVVAHADTRELSDRPAC